MDTFENSEYRNRIILLNYDELCKYKYDYLGNVLKKINAKQENNNLISDVLIGLKYENKNKISELINPINFFVWLLVSFKDIF